MLGKRTKLDYFGITTDRRFKNSPVLKATALEKNVQLSMHDVCDIDAGGVILRLLLKHLEVY